MGWTVETRLLFNYVVIFIVRRLSFSPKPVLKAALYFSRMDFARVIEGWSRTSVRLQLCNSAGKAPASLLPRWKTCRRGWDVSGTRSGSSSCVTSRLPISLSCRCCSLRASSSYQRKGILTSSCSCVTGILNFLIVKLFTNLMMQRRENLRTGLFILSGLVKCRQN